MTTEDDEGQSRKRHLYDHVRMQIDSGLYTKKEVFDTIERECSDRTVPVLAAEQPKLRGYAAKRWTLRESEEQAWTTRTTNDCIDAAFAALNQAGIVALQNAGWTMSTGWEDCWAEHERIKEAAGSEAAGSETAGGAPRGAVFYHTQDLERGVEGQGLFLAFGAFHERDDGDPAANAQIAAEVCAVLRQHGVEAEWDGEPQTRIRIPPFPWRKRRSSRAPETPLPPTPWRRLRHPDGRSWQARLSGRWIELRIDLGDDDPLERRREHPSEQAAQAEFSALLRDQLADGFTEEG